MVLFLDFDGVLHPDPCRDRARLFEHAPRLAAALAPYRTLQIVLSTAWRTHADVATLSAHLPPALAARVAGVTPLFQHIGCAPRWAPYRRQAECLRWLADHGGDRQPWIALDDRADGFEPYCENLLLTCSATGLDDTVLNRLRFALLRAQRHAAPPAAG